MFPYCVFENGHQPPVAVDHDPLSMFNESCAIARPQYRGALSVFGERGATGKAWRLPLLVRFGTEPSVYVELSDIATNLWFVV